MQNALLLYRQSHVGGSNPALALETAVEKTMWQNPAPWAHGLRRRQFCSRFIGGDRYRRCGHLCGGGCSFRDWSCHGKHDPGGKIATTVGKPAKGAVGMAKGAGTAARVAEGAHEAEQVMKAARQAEEAAKLAKEGKAANREASQKWGVKTSIRRLELVGTEMTGYQGWIAKPTGQSRPAEETKK